MRRTIVLIVGLLIIFPCRGFASSGGIPPEKAQVKESKPKSLKKSIQKSKPSKAAAKKETGVKKVTPSESKEETARAKAIRKKRELIRLKKSSLNNLEWDIEITSLSNKGDVSKDILIFQENKVRIQGLVGKGFLPTNYTLTVQDDGVLVWETMQTLENGQVVFMRGEITSDIKTMRGVMNYPKRVKDNDYNFISVDKRLVSP